MKLLAIDTSSAALSVAAYSDGRLAERLETKPRQHAELILQYTDQVLAELGLKLSDLDAIAYGYGPGSFTSLRIGLGVIQGLALGAELNVIPISSLLAVAQAATPDDYQNSLVCMDARMGEVYSARCSRNEAGLMQLVSAELVSPPAKIDIPDVADWLALGSGFAEYADQFSHQLNMITDCWPLASAIIQLAIPQLVVGNTLDATEVVPKYVRNKVAKTTKERQM